MNYAAFLSYVLLTAFTPGPNNIMSMTNAGKYGFKRAFPFNVGVLLGFLAVMTICAVFSTLLYREIPPVKPYMLVLGAGYIAYSVWRDKPHKERGGLSQTNTVLSGMLLQFVNVKCFLYGITALSSFVLPHYSSPLVVALFVVLLSVIGFVSTVCWALFGAAFERFFQRHAKLLNAAMALLLVWSAWTMVKELLV